ncbi:MAG: aminotransferase class I/II-fold pyridoxal phosphate-dependent enzyme [Syntrophobacterales bacterium]|nr:aminotransferase class I/II-fold pyridoxal phosphate-dependent enzyme [Syntrophobacterales bacterium]
MRITRRASEITPFYVMELLEKAKAMEAKGEDIVHMEVGEPDFPSPAPVKEEAMKAISENRTFYTHSLGLPDLRERIARYYLESHNVNISPERIVITSGTSGAFLLLSVALVERGDLLVLSDPGYPCYKNFGAIVDAVILPLPVSHESNYALTANHFRDVKEEPRAVIISNPSNPTGSVYGEKTLSDLYQFLSGNGVSLIVDEIYSGLSYGCKVTTALAISDEIIVVNGFSKTYAMTGWRLGWMVVPDVLVRPIQKVAQNVFISPPSISQYAAIHAFAVKEELDRMVETYKKRRDFMLKRLKKLGFRIPVDPQGAFYIYADIDKWNMDSMVFVERALREAKAAITPGYDFGSFRASSHVRFSYANSMERLAEGCDRLEAWLADR